MSLIDEFMKLELNKINFKMLIYFFLSWKLWILLLGAYDIIKSLTSQSTSMHSCNDTTESDSEVSKTTRSLTLHV